MDQNLHENRTIRMGKSPTKFDQQPGAASLYFEEIEGLYLILSPPQNYNAGNDDCFCHDESIVQWALKGELLNGLIFRFQEQ